MAMGPSKTVMPTMTLSQFLPAWIWRRPAANSGLRPAVNATPVTKESPSRIHAFNQSRRPADPKRHAAVIARLKQTPAKRLMVASRIDPSRGLLYHFRPYFLFVRTGIGSGGARHRRSEAGPRLFLALSPSPPVEWPPSEGESCERSQSF